MPSTTPRFGIVASRFNSEITESLVAGALAAFKAHRLPVSAVKVVWVPGAFELPIAALKMARSRRYGAVVAVGCIMEGQTPQFTYLAQATYQGLVMASLVSGVPVTCGVITAKQWRHAVERSRIKGMNRGGEAAEVAWEMVHALKGIGKNSGRR